MSYGEIQTYTFGRSTKCDIRIQLPDVSEKHCQVEVDENGKVFCENVSDLKTRLNEEPISGMTELKNGDIFSISDRSFKYIKAETPVKKKATPKATTPKALTPSSAGRQRKALPTPIRSAIATKKRTSPRDSQHERQTSIRFGAPLQPELIDKNLPSNTPVRRGVRPNGMSALRKQIAAEMSLKSVPKMNLMSPKPTASKPESPKPVTLEQTPSISAFEVAKGGHRSTPVRNAIKQGVTLKSTKSEKTAINTPIRESIRNGVQLRKTKHSMKTPLRVAIQNSIKLRATKRVMREDMLAAIHGGCNLRKVLKKALSTPIRKSIIKGCTLRPRFAKLDAKLQEHIKEGCPLKKLKKVQVDETIKVDDAGEVTIADIFTFFDDAEESDIAEVFTSDPVSDDISIARDEEDTIADVFAEYADEEGNIDEDTIADIFSMFADEDGEVNKDAIAGVFEMIKDDNGNVPKPVVNQVIDMFETDSEITSSGTPLRKLITSIYDSRADTPKSRRSSIGIDQTPSKARAMMKKEAAAVIADAEVKGKKKRAEELAGKLIHTPLKKAIHTGMKLKQVKRKAVNTPVRNEIKRGTQLKKVMKKSLNTPIRNALKGGKKLKSTKVVPALSTPVRAEIKHGKKLKSIKPVPALNTPIRAEIKQSKKLRSTKPTPAIATPVRNAIKAGVKLNNIMKKSLNTPTRTAIKKGKLLKSVYWPHGAAKVPAAVQNAIKNGKKLKSIKPRAAIATPVRKAIKNGVKLNKVMKKSINTPARKAIRAGVQLKKVSGKSPYKLVTPTKKVMTPKTATPKTATPKAMTPKVATPKTMTPKTATPKAATPKTMTPKVATPKTMTPKAATPKASTKKTPKAKTAVIAKPSADFSSMKVVELRAELSSRGMDTKGVKAVLIKRLVAAVEPSPPLDETPVKLVVNKRKLSIVAEKTETLAETLDETLTKETPVTDFASMKVVELRAELECRGLETKGVKAVLIKRLLESVKTVAKTDEPIHEAEEVVLPPTKKARSKSTKAAETVEMVDGSPPKDFTSMKVAELRAELESRGMDTKGLKAVLIKRLTMADAPSIDIETVNEAPRKRSTRGHK